MARAGPTPMISGGHPTTAWATNLPIIGNPCYLATDLLANKIAEAPSVTYDELPPVLVPPFLKAPFNLANPYKVVPSLIPSSSVTVISY